MQSLESALRYTRGLTYLFVHVYWDPKHYRPLQSATYPPDSANNNLLVSIAALHPIDYVITTSPATSQSLPSSSSRAVVLLSAVPSRKRPQCRVETVAIRLRHDGCRHIRLRRFLRCGCVSQSSSEPYLDALVLRFDFVYTVKPIQR